MKKLKPTKTEADYDKAIARINKILDLNPKAGSEEDNELEILSALVEVL